MDPISGEPEEVSRQLLELLKVRVPALAPAVARGASELQSLTGSPADPDYVYGALLPEALELLANSDPAAFQSTAPQLSALLEELLHNTPFIANYVHVSFLEALADRPALARVFRPYMARELRRSFDLISL